MEKHDRMKNSLSFLSMMILAALLTSCASTDEGARSHSSKLRYDTRELKDVTFTPEPGVELETGQKVKLDFRLEVPEDNYQAWAKPGFPTNYSELTPHGFSLDFADSPRYTSGTVTVERTFGLTYNRLKDRRGASDTNFPAQIVVTNIIFTLKNIQSGAPIRELTRIRVEYTWNCSKTPSKPAK